MNKPLTNKIIAYSSLFFTAIVSLPKLLAQYRDSIIAGLVPFNLYEWLLQDIMSFAFCVSFFLYNRNHFTYFNTRLSLQKHGRLVIGNIILLTVFTLVGGTLSRVFFFHITMFPLNGYFVRLAVLAIFVLIEIKLLATLFYAQQKESENEQLRLANMSMELDLLKAQLNPHFFFNALSSLSGVVRENPEKAQQYISHLSKIFRYSLTKPKQGLVTLKEELEESVSFSELMKMRHEDGFFIRVQADAEDNKLMLPQMSLQPLIENALKHNISTAAKPLHILLTVNDHILTFSNNLQPKPFPEHGTGIGLANLNERFKLMMQQEISISWTDKEFIIKLPLK